MAPTQWLAGLSLEKGKNLYQHGHKLLLPLQLCHRRLRRSRTCSLRIMFRDLSHTAWARGISQSYTLPTSFQSPCPPLCPSLYAHPSRSLPRSSTGILC